MSSEVTRITFASVRAVGANVTIVEQQLNIFEVCTLQFKHYSEAADMENKKEQVKLNDELLEKVSGGNCPWGNLPADDYGEYMEINDSGFCRCQNPEPDLDHRFLVCKKCGQLL
jgi:hypothetical protein